MEDSKVVGELERGHFWKEERLKLTYWARIFQNITLIMNHPESGWISQ